MELNPKSDIMAKSTEDKDSANEHRSQLVAAPDLSP